MVGFKEPGSDTLPPSPPRCARKGCYEYTDGQREVCCTACGDGKHTTACAIRQMQHRPPRQPRYVPAARLRVCGTISAVLILLATACCRPAAPAAEPGDTSQPPAAPTTDSAAAPLAPAGGWPCVPSRGPCASPA